MEPWNYAILELCNPGTWNYGTLEPWNYETMKPWNYGTWNY